MINFNSIIFFVIIVFILYNYTKKQDENQDKEKEYNKLSNEYSNLYNKFNKLKSDQKDNVKKVIRQNKDKDDQKRTMNAKQALEAGSDCLIIGRPITKGNPKKNIQEILSSLN